MSYQHSQMSERTPLNHVAGDQSRSTLLSDPSVSRVRVTGYVPDLDPLNSHNPPKQLHRLDTPQYGAIANSAETPSTPFLSWISRDNVESSLQNMFREGSVRGSVFNLCSATLGAGALSLPYAFSQAGLALGLVLLLVGAAATIFSIKLLILARVRTNLTSYEDMTVVLFGRTMGVIVELNIIVFCFGTAVAYCRAVGDILNPVVGLLDLPSWMNERLTMCFFWLVVMFPLSLLKKMNSLRFSSLFGVLTILYLVIATMTHCLHHVNFAHDVPWSSTDFWLSGSFSGVVQAAPIVIFAFTCQVNVFAIYDELEKASEKRMSRVTNHSMALCLLVYVLMGFFGYVNFEKDTCGNILTNYRHELKSSGLIVASYLCITLTILMAFPLVIFPCRYTVEVMINDFAANSRIAQDTPVRHVCLTLLISGASLLLSLFVPSISVVFQLIGGTTSAFVCFVMPAAFSIKLKLNKSFAHQAGAWALGIGGVAVGVLSTVVTIYNIATNTKSNC